MSIGENIRYLRKKNNLMQSELAKIVNVHGSNVSHWEADKVEPPLGKLIALSTYFKISLDSLVHGEPANFDSQNYYGVSDYGAEARRIFLGFNKDEQDNLLRTMYKHRIQYHRRISRPISFTPQQFAAMFLTSPNIVLQEFGRYMQKILDTYDTIPDKRTQDLINDTSLYVVEGAEDTPEFETLIREIIEELFRPLFFETAYANGNFTIEHLSKQFKIAPKFTLLALNYYKKIKGELFTYKKLTVDLSELPPESETDYTKGITIYPTK